MTQGCFGVLKIGTFEGSGYLGLFFFFWGGGCFWLGSKRDFYWEVGVLGAFCLK